MRFPLLLLAVAMFPLSTLAAPPDQPYTPPERPAADGAPLIYSHTDDVGPDQSFLLVGEGFSEKDGLTAWGPSPDAPGGKEIQPKLQFVKNGILAATLPDKTYDGPILVWAKNAKGFSQPVTLNAPQPWWCLPEKPEQGTLVGIFGRNLARRPDCSQAFVYLNQPSKPDQAGTWLKVKSVSKYRLEVVMPERLAAGEYFLWVHAGRGGKFGWGTPLKLQVREPVQRPLREVPLAGGDLQEAVDKLGQQGGGILKIPAGTHMLKGTLVVPANVLVAGGEEEETVLQAPDDPKAIFPAIDGSKEPNPKADRAVVWLAGDNAALFHLTIAGSARTNLGIAVRSPKFPEWIRGCNVERVSVRDVEGKQVENCAIRLYHADESRIVGSEFWGRSPIFLSGVRASQILGNTLVAQTRWGGNAEAYINGRNETVRRCLIENNICASPPGSQGGGPTGRRMIWLSTGRGSVDHNWIANNREENARFGGVAGTDQNVGEMILFEACERYVYYGPAAGADTDKVTLPAKLPATPDDRLGNVKREQLAHDAAGNEIPFWPPDADRNDGEPVATEYYVTVLKGRGMGQTRRVAGRKGETYLLDRPWRVVPQAGSLILVHTAYYRNHIVGNRTVDGMTGIQLWISCIENIVSDNEVARQRKPALYLYGTCTTLASSMPTEWNRGIGPFYFNHIEGTRASETSCGALVISGNDSKLPVEFPHCLGNVLRHNSFAKNRTDGVLITGGRSSREGETTPAVLGTIAEFNVVRDALFGYHVAGSADATLLRRNHAYFWYPVSNQPDPPVAFQLDDPKAAAVLELNSVEGIHGGSDGRILEEQRGPSQKPVGRR